MIGWVKRNKLASLLLLVILLYIAKSYFGGFSGVPLLGNSAKTMTYESMPAAGGADSSMQALRSSDIMPPESDYAPAPEVQNRLVIESSDLSLLVKNVTEVRDKIVENAQANGGYMVSSSISNPQDAPTATVTVRVPASKLKATLDYYYSLSIKVVSENLTGQDVTDQYVDVEARIGTLEKTKARFEAILAQAGEISDITNLNQQIIYIQSQIDSLKGQQQALAKNAEMARLTVYLSTDEIALPYAPSETFRPGVIFKLAVRSLVGMLRDVAAGLIWIGVYAVIWVPVALITYLIYRKLRQSRTN